MKRMIRGCSTPLTTFNIMSNGDVILCCDDFSNKLILGNVNETSIKEIWNSNELLSIKKLHKEGNFPELKVCSNCDWS